MKKIRFGILMSAAVLFFLISGISPQAKNAMTSWTGSASAGVMPRDPDCPLTVEHEKLTFMIRDLPVSHYKDQKDFAGYHSYVRAEYTFRNPTDEHVTADLAFPFGNYPVYLPWDDTDRHVLEGEQGKYEVLRDGKPAETVLRYTYHPDSYEPLDPETEAELLCDGYCEDDFYSPDRSVYKYVYQVHDVKSSTRNLTAKCYLPVSENRRYIVSGNFRTQGDRYEVTLHPDEKACFTIYVIAEEPGTPPSVQMNTGAGWLSWEMEWMPLSDYISDSKPDLNDLSDTDYYNAYVAMLKEKGNILTAQQLKAMNLMMWYQYQIELEPGETAVNTVMAPLYPTIEEKYKPPVYEYTFLLSAASAWEKYGTLDISVKTDMYMTDCTIAGFTEKEYAYEAHFDTLPKGDLKFNLCASNDPGRNYSEYGSMLMILIPMILFGFAMPFMMIGFGRLMKRALTGKKE